MSAASASLQLDARQRAMLREMGVTVWLPPEEPVAPVAAPAAAPRVVPAPVIAMKNIAVKVENTPTTSPFEQKEALPPALGERPAGIEAMGWAELQEAVSGCTACGLCKARKNAVLGVGSRQARWLVVGEAPGEQEDLRGEPFVGPSGQLLDNMLRSVGLARAASGSEGAVYIANVIKCRPPGNRNPEPQEVAQCAPFLRRQIELLQPDMILALGKFAAQTLLQESVPQVQTLPLGKLRGTVHRYQAGGRSVPVVVSYHPAYLLRSLTEKAKAWADLCLALDAANVQELAKIPS